jgi:hypothetical protein
VREREKEVIRGGDQSAFEVTLSNKLEQNQIKNEPEKNDKKKAN